MNELFVEIADGFYLEAKSIKIIVDYSKKNNKVQLLISRCKENDRLRKVELDKKKALNERNLDYDNYVSYRKRYFTHSKKTDDGTYRYIITRNNELHSTALSFEELKRRCFSSGLKLVDMSEQSCVALSYIEGIDNVSSELVLSSRRTWSAEMASLQFVSGSASKVNTILWLKTHEVVKLSKDTQEILEQIQSFQEK